MTNGDDGIGLGNPSFVRSDSNPSHLASNLERSSTRVSHRDGKRNGHYQSENLSASFLIPQIFSMSNFCSSTPEFRFRQKSQSKFRKFSCPILYPDSEFSEFFPPNGVGIFFYATYNGKVSRFLSLSRKRSDTFRSTTLPIGRDTPSDVASLFGIAKGKSAFRKIVKHNSAIFPFPIPSPCPCKRLPNLSTREPRWPRSTRRFKALLSQFDALNQC